MKTYKFNKSYKGLNLRTIKMRIKFYKNGYEKCIEENWYWSVKHYWNRWMMYSDMLIAKKTRSKIQWYC